MPSGDMPILELPIRQLSQCGVRQVTLAVATWRRDHGLLGDGRQFGSENRLLG